MTDSLEYLESIAERMIYYDKIRLDILEYIMENEISDSNLQTDLFIVGILHHAYKRGEKISEDDLAILLGDTDHNENFSPLRIVEIAEEKQQLSFLEALDYTVENYQC